MDSSFEVNIRVWFEVSTRLEAPVHGCAAHPLELGMLILSLTRMLWTKVGIERLGCHLDVRIEINVDVESWLFPRSLLVGIFYFSMGLVAIPLALFSAFLLALRTFLAVRGMFLV